MATARAAATAPWTPGEDLAVFSDRGSVEVFIGNGTHTLSSLDFSGEGDRTLTVTAINGPADVTATIEQLSP